METTEKENAPNGGINLQANVLTDLPVTDEQADETKGGLQGAAARWEQIITGDLPNSGTGSGVILRKSSN